jgi:hypothetical protein
MKGLHIYEKDFMRANLRMVTPVSGGWGDSGLHNRNGSVTCC